MHERIVHEVATPLQLDLDEMEWGPQSDNDDTYKEYCRLLGSSAQIAWYTHECSYCKELIHSGEWYERIVYLVKELGKKKQVLVVKKHDPECPRDLYEMEANMERERDEEERAAHREAA